MRILDKYILNEFMAPFLFGVAAFTAIFLGSDTLLKIAEYVTKYGASAVSALKIFILAIPRIVVYTFPMAVLLGSLMCFLRLSSSSELIVMRTAGQSFNRLARPVFIVAFVISLFSVAFNEYVVPWTNQEYQRIVNTEIKRNMNPGVTNHVVIRDVQHGKIVHLLYARKYNPKDKTLSNITIQEFQDEKVVRVENAPVAQWINGSWVMKDGIIYDLTQDGVDRMMRFSQQAISYADSPDNIQKSQKDVDEMTIRELREQKDAFEAAHVDTANISMEIQRRFSIPLASFIFALIGAPLGVQKQRSSSSIGFGVSVVIIFLYYAVMTFTGALGRGHVLPPVVAVWIPNIIALAVGLYLIRRASR
jgi:lipopolysaccharide export system permease protein